MDVRKKAQTAAEDEGTVSFGVSEKKIGEKDIPQRSGGPAPSLCSGGTERSTDG